uniref:Uncharacterized protein n=1 Tax=Opuntia streptacantha TaxID=393608 RepID=A0A7C9AAV4_OPUST
MLIHTMHSFTVFLVLCLVRLVCSWFQQFLGDSVGLESVVDSCWVSGKVVIRDHYNLDYVTVVFRIILIIPVIVICDLVLIVLFMVIFGNEVWGQRQLSWSLDHLVSVYPLLPWGLVAPVLLIFGSFTPTWHLLWSMMCISYAFACLRLLFGDNVYVGILGTSLSVSPTVFLYWWVLSFWEVFYSLYS